MKKIFIVVALLLVASFALGGFAMSFSVCGKDSGAKESDSTTILPDNEIDDNTDSSAQVLKEATFSTLEDATRFIVTNNVEVFKIVYEGVIIVSGEDLPEPYSINMPISFVYLKELTESVGAYFLYGIESMFGEGLGIYGVYSYDEETGEEFIDFGVNKVVNEGVEYANLTLDITGVEGVVVYYADKLST